VSEPLKAPWPWFGGKSRIAGAIWERLGKVDNYVEPFFGSGATLLAAPWPSGRVETVNDLDGMVANFWRAVAREPDTVAHHADWPVNENDLHARHSWLVARKDSLAQRLEGDPDYCDAKVAGWWAWGMSCWIGSGFCSGEGPWRQVDGLLVRDNAGRGVNRQLPHLGAGRGVNRQLPHLGNAGLLEWISRLSERLRRTRVCCGDWSRVTGPSVTTAHGLTGVVLDPPYADTADRCDSLYAHDSLTVAHDVREWAIANGGNKLLRIALCGYEGEHQMPGDWECLEWSATGGYASEDNENQHRERIWFSPHCQSAKQGRLF
jgi:site-specific DNA-adenine methylase